MKYEVPIQMTLGRILHLVTPEDAKLEAAIGTDPQSDKTDYELTIKLRWSRTHTSGPPWHWHYQRYQENAVITLPGGDYEVKRKSDRQP